MIRMLHVFQGFDSLLLQKVNRHFDKKSLNWFLRLVTNLGGADITITTAIVLLIVSSGDIRLVAISSALALSLSHIPVHIAKELFPRKRPYLMIKDTKFPANPLKDHSFPSGHTTAIFSVITPYVLFMPNLALFLIPLALCVGISRVYLGLHYPSDVIAGGLLGSLTGFLTFYLLCM